MTDIIERIQEAAFLPEIWPQLLEDLSRRSESMGGLLMLIPKQAAPCATASSALFEVTSAYIESGDYSGLRRRTNHFLSMPPGFYREIDAYSEEELQSDPLYQQLLADGLGAFLGTQIVMPTGNMAVVAFHRAVGDGSHSLSVRQEFSAFLPALSRAAMISTQLWIERHRTRVSLLDGLGLPAAVLNRQGQLLAVNDLLAAMDDVFVFAAHGRMRLREAADRALFQRALDRLEGTEDACSTPLPARAGRAPLILHFLPLRRNARDFFAGGDVVLVVNRLAMSAMAPDEEVVAGLFDLTSREAQLATALAAGKTLQAQAAEAGVTVKTARTYLERVFQKTGTHRQGELVALLKSALCLPPCQRIDP